MRSRNIKPGFYKNEDLAEASLLARFIVPGLWMMADRNGRLENRPKLIKAELLPYDDGDLTVILLELYRAGHVTLYEVGGKQYIQINNFSVHQSPHHTEKQGVIPAPLLNRDLTVNSPLLDGEYPPDSLIPDSLNHETSVSLFGQVSGVVQDMLASTVPHNMSIIHSWLNAGAIPESDIYPVIKRINAKGKTFPPAYYDKPILQAIADRTKKATLPEATFKPERPNSGNRKKF